MNIFEEGLLQISPTERVKVERFLSLLFDTASATGVRGTLLTRLKVKDFDFPNKQISVRSRSTANQYSSRRKLLMLSETAEISIPSLLADRLRDYITEYRSPTGVDNSDLYIFRVRLTGQVRAQKPKSQSESKSEFTSKLFTTLSSYRSTHIEMYLKSMKKK